MSKGYPRGLARANTSDPKVLKVVRYLLTNLIVTVTATGSADAFGGTLFGRLPEGNVLVFGAAGMITITTADADPSATWSGQASVGTTIDADGNLHSPVTDDNVILTTVIGPAVAKTISNKSIGSVNTGLTALVNNTANNQALNLNLRINNADMADASNAPLTVNGFIDVYLAVAGDT